MNAGGRAVLILGASGFIGARVAAAVAAAGYEVKAGARHPEEARRRLPQYAWVDADFARLVIPASWRPLLDGVDAVVNCVGVLQDGAGDSSRIAHVAAPLALIAACEEAGVRRLIHVSAIGADEGAGTLYARDKQETERLLAASRLDWITVRPSLVIAREVYGGTALMRGLAGLPGVIPLVAADQTFRPIHSQDLATIIADLLEPSIGGRRVIEAAGPQTVSLAELVSAYRAWLGFAPAPVLRLPSWIASPVLKAGDAAGWLGWASPLRTTSIRQLVHGAAGRAPTPAGVRPFSEALSAEPAGVQDRWHARLYFVRPLAVITLGLFWLATGLITLGPGQRQATEIMVRAGFGRWAHGAAVGGGWLDVALAALFFVRRSTRLAALAMVGVSGAYLVVASLRLGWLWLDPLGPWLKVLPIMALCLFVVATDDRR